MIINILENALVVLIVMIFLLGTAIICGTIGYYMISLIVGMFSYDVGFIGFVGGTLLLMIMAFVLLAIITTVYEIVKGTYKHRKN